MNENYQVKCINCFNVDLQTYINLENRAIIIACENCETLVAIIKVEEKAVEKFKESIKETTNE
jgi:hypothetical protein